MDDTQNTSNALNEFVKTPWFYAVIAVIFVIAVWFFLSRRNRQNLQKQVEDGQIRLNSLKSVPLPFKVSRALALSRVNREIEETVRTCSGNFDTIQTNFKELQELINDADELLQSRKYGAAKEKLAQMDNLLGETDTTVGDLDKVLNTILDQENIQRQKILDLKESFREIKISINNNPDKYLFCWEALDRRINTIEHQFSEFETIMAASAFDKATEKTEEIRNSITSLNDVVVSIPDLINVSKGEIPIMIEDVQNSYSLITKKGANLDHLEIESNLNLINDSLQEDLRKIKQCDISGVNQHLLDCEKRLNQLKQQIEKERASFDELLALKETATTNLAQLNATVDKLNTNYDELVERYGINDFSDTLADATNKVKTLNESSHIVMNSIHENKLPASNQLLTLSQLNTEIVVALNNVNKMADTVNSACADEESAREQLTKRSIVLNEVQSKISTSRIPNISAKYNDDLVKAEDYINRLDAQLQETPINVTLVNSLKNSATDMVYQLFESVNRILGTAYMAENAIVIGNQYRSNHLEIDSELTRAELAYRNGEYTQALTIALNALRKVHPETVSKLIDSGKKAQA